jgi:cytochrome c
MKLSFLLPLLMAVAVSAFAMADGGATLDDAKAMAEKAAAHYRQAGEATALADFMKPEWRDRDLYVVAIKSDGSMVVNGGSPALVGRNVIDMRDIDGKLISREQLAVKDRAWIEYKWRNPQTNAVGAKSTYTIRLSDDLVLGVGAYK